MYIEQGLYVNYVTFTVSVSRLSWDFFKDEIEMYCVIANNCPK